MKKAVFKTVLMIVVALSVASCGWLNDYSRGQKELDAVSTGKQILYKAENSKKAKIEAAKADNEAAVLEASTAVTLAKSKAEAEIIRAKGVAEANKIIGESLKGNESYLRYLWITGLNDGKGERIYIPTEAGLPILERK